MTDALNSDNSVRVVTLPDDVAPVVLFGSRDEVLRAMERGMREVSFHLRGNEVTMAGDAGAVNTAVTL